MLTNLPVQLVGTEHLVRVPIFEHMKHDLLHIIEILLRLQRVVYTVVALLVKLGIGHIGVVAEVGAARGFDQSVRHKGASRNDRVNHAAVNQLSNDQTLLRDRHRAGQSHHHEAILVASHGLEHVGGFTKLATSEGSLRHGAYQIVD